MKFQIEPDRARTFCNNVLAFSGGKGQAQSAVVKFTKDGAEVRAMLATDLLLMANYNKDYFLNPDAFQADNELLVVHQPLIKEDLSHGFKGKTMSVHTDAEWIYFDGEDKDDHVKRKLIAPDPEAVLKHKVEMTEVGLIYHKKAKISADDKAACTQDPKVATVLENFNLQALIQSSSFGDLPTSAEVKIVYDNDGLKLVVNDELMQRTRPIATSRILGDSPSAVTATFSREMIEAVIAQFDGEVWLSLNERRMVLSQKNKNYALSYGLIAKQEA